MDTNGELQITQGLGTIATTPVVPARKLNSRQDVQGGRHGANGSPGGIINNNN